MMVETVTSDSPVAEYSITTPPTQRLDVQPESVTLRCGTLSVDIGQNGFGRIELDGKAVRSRRLVIESIPGQLVKVTIEVVP